MTDPAKDILVIKWDTDSFERAYNDKLGEYADVLPVSQFYDVHCPDKKEKKRCIREAIERLDRERDLSHYGKIIIFEDLNLTWALAKYVPDSKRVHLWYWNIVDLCRKDKIKLQLVKKMCSAWTFDEGQAKELGLKLNTQFYIGEPYAGDPGCDYDLFFVEQDKGRKELLDKISSFCGQNGLKAKIVITGGKDADGNVTGFMEYPDVIDCVRRSRAVLEIGREDQTGLTVRSLEALYFNKALVTNNKQIYEKKYFGKDNSYILDPEDTSGLAEFIRSSTPRYSPEAYDYYSVKSWLERF